MSNLLRQGAAVLLWHALPHRLFHRLDFLAQRDARRGGWFDHFSVYCFLLFILWKKETEWTGQGRKKTRWGGTSQKHKESQGKKGSQRQWRTLKIKGDLMRHGGAQLLHAPWNWASRQHSRWPRSLRWPHAENGWTGQSPRSCMFSVGEPKHSQMSHTKKVTLEKPFRPHTPTQYAHNDSCLAWHRQRFD